MFDQVSAQIDAAAIFASGVPLAVLAAGRLYRLARQLLIGRTISRILQSSPEEIFVQEIDGKASTVYAASFRRSPLDTNVASVRPTVACIIIIPVGQEYFTRERVALR